jgi:hypothetical protein
VLLKERINTGKKWLEDNPEKSADDVNEEIRLVNEHNMSVMEELKQVSEFNDNVDKVNRYLEAKKVFESKEAEYKNLTKEIKAIDDELLKSISGFNLSEIVPGIELKYVRSEDTGKVTDVGLYLDGLPFNKKQHSYGKLIIAIIKLSSFFNADKLNFVSIYEWNLIDKKGQDEIFEFVKNNPDLNIQLGIEKVDDNTDIVTEIFEL